MSRPNLDRAALGGRHRAGARPRGDRPMILVLRPAMLTARGQRYAAVLDGRTLCNSRQPLFDAARVLLSEGFRAGDGARGPAPRAAPSSRCARRWARPRERMERDRGGLHRELWKPREDAPHSFAGVPENALEAAE